MSEIATEAAVEPKLSLKFLSHGKLECDDIEASRRFYTELLGLEAVRTSPTTGMLRLNSVMTIAVVQTKSKNRAGLFSHFGLDVDTTDEVDAARKIVIANKEEYGIKKITESKIDHGTYAFYFEDRDGNWWEILTNPEGGYSHVFSHGGDLPPDIAWTDSRRTAPLKPGRTPGKDLKGN